MKRRKKTIFLATRYVVADAQFTRKYYEKSFPKEA